MMASAIVCHTLVKAASERTRMVGRRAHTGSLRHRDWVVLLGDNMVGDRSVGGDGAVVD